MNKRQVTPMLSTTPERSYLQEGRLIKVYAVISYKHDASGTKLELSSLPLSSFEMGRDYDADLFMEDLFYGEYTGS